MQILSLQRAAARLMVIALAVTACNEPGQQKGQLVIENKDEVDRPNELVVLKRSELQSKVDSLTPGKYILLQEAGRPLVVQHDDLDGDGNWDEIAFLISLNGKGAQTGGKKTLDISVSDAPATVKAVVRAHVRHMRKNADNTFGDDLVIDSMPAGQPATDFSKQAYPPFLTEGPSWENDKVGFRLYFDVRNGKDIWGKITSRMVLDEVGRDTANNYHAIADWGMDILKVGKSLGAGALALAVKTSAGKDTLVRLGNVNMGLVTYQKITDGPVRAIFRLHYPAWKILDSVAPVSLTEEISIWGGQYFYESKVTINGAPAGARLVTGIVNLHSKEAKNIEESGYKVLYTYDAQSEKKDNLGMALLVSNEVFDGFITTPNANTDIQNTYAIALKTAKQPIIFRFYAGWQSSDGQFDRAPSFEAFLRKEIQRKNPVSITY